jgi:predicted methyltransferase
MIKEKIRVIASAFSEETNRYYRLLDIPDDLPCLEIAGIRMHRTKKGVKESVKAMVKALYPIRGKVLDCCFGLGYTAIEMAKHDYVEEVYVFENDEKVLEIAQMNEYSREAFTNPKIRIMGEDITEGIRGLPDCFFSRILHDPPSLKIAGELYSGSFYRELYRVLKFNGRLFHYTGSPYAERGVNVMKGIIKRLREAGFDRIEEEPAAAGVVAQKRMPRRGERGFP